MSHLPNPPRLAEKFFAWFCHRNHLEGLEGDLYEMFERNIKKHGLRKARLLYLANIVTLLRSTVARPVIYNSKFNTMDMYKNYLLTAVRMGWKRKGFSFINLMGLTFGISSTLFIALFLADELKYDRHVDDHQHKYRVYIEYHSSAGLTRNQASVPPMFGPEFKKNFPQVAKAGRLFFIYGGNVFRADEKIFAEKNGFFAEKEALEILNVQLLAGSMETLAEANTVLLAEATYNRFFGDAPFSEQTIIIGDDTSIKIGGIYADFPNQSHIRPDYLVSFELLKTYVPEERMNSWVWQQFFTYVELEPGTNTDQLFKEIGSFVEKTAWPITKERNNFHYEPRFQGLADIHLHSDNMQWDVASHGSFQSVVFLFLAALIILIIACLNFINLTTAQALQRAKEVIVRKFVGANRSQLIVQHVAESLVYVALAGVVSLVLFALLLPYFNQFSGKSFHIVQVLSLARTVLFILFLLVLGVVSGVYPALVITAFKPLDVLRGSSSLGAGKGGFRLQLRQVMVGVQYVLSISLVLISLVMQRQYSYLQNTDMGFNKENLLVVPLTGNMRTDLEQTKRRFSSHSNVLGISACYGVPGGVVAGDNITVPGNNERKQTINAFMVDEDYIPTMDMRMLAGRNFSKDIRSDESQSFIINETAVRNFGFGTPEQALGKALHWDMWNDADTVKKGRVIGVVEDFNYKSLHNPVESSVLQIDRRNFSFLVLKIGPGDLGNTVAYLEEQYGSIEPNRVFEFEFIDRSFQEFYESEQRTSQMFLMFTVLAIFTAAIGLFGLVSYSVVSRGKEIGIRKVLGAGTKTIFFLLVRRYFVLLGISLAIALPLAHYAVSGWLDNFTYRIEIDAGIFLMVAGLAVLMTIVTVGYQALKGASANPSEKLRTE